MYAPMRILAVLALMGLVISCDQRGQESPTSDSTAERSAAHPFVIDTPSLLGKDAQKVRKMMEAQHGKPYVFKQPSTEALGTLTWTVEGMRFGFDFYQDGQIGPKRAGTVVLVGLEEDGHTVDSVLRAANLSRNADDYVLDIDAVGGFIEIHIRPSGTFRKVP